MIEPGFETMTTVIRSRNTDLFTDKFSFQERKPVDLRMVTDAPTTFYKPEDRRPYITELLDVF
jgi:hypothetical protein